MNDFDWVTARANCSLGAMFERLKMQLDADVKKRIALHSEMDQFGFTLVPSGSTVSVVVQGSHIHGSIEFVLAGNGIEVRKDGHLRFRATPTICDDGECRLMIGNEVKELWQLRKMALEKLFFSPYSELSAGSF